MSRVWLAETGGDGGRKAWWAASPAQAAWVGASLGVVAGVIAALGDFGALWLWVQGWGDRGALLLRLIVSLGGAGAGLGAVVGVALWAGEGLRARVLAASPPVAGRALARAVLRAVASAAPLALLLLPGLVAVSWLLFGGARASRMAPRGVGASLVLAALLAGVVLSLAVLRRASLLRQRWGHGALALGMAALYFALSKLDQHAFPNLYAYLHVSLSLAGWAAAAAAVWFAGLAAGVLSVGEEAAQDGAAGCAVVQPARFVARCGGAALVVSALAFAVHVGTLGQNPNVRVLLFDPRAASSQSLMRGVEPLLRLTVDERAAARAIEDARLARERRRAVLAAGMDLPTWEGAHVLLITVDALRPDHLGFYGYARGTSPNLDALAKESVVFERAYAPAPHSSFSLSSLFASEYLHETVETDAPPPTETLPVALRKHGYRDGAFFPQGVFHTEGQRLTVYRDSAFGFQRYDNTAHAAEALTDAVLAEVKRVVRDGEAPTLLWAHYFDVHEPYEATHFGRSPVDRYDSEILATDRAIGRLLAGVRSALRREVIVVMTADHGEEFREHGGVYHGSTLYEEQIRVPLLIHAPELAPRRVPEQVETVDLAPTLLGMTGAAVPARMRGDDLRAVLVGRIPSAGPAFAGVTHKRMVVRWPHKLIADLRFGLFELYDLQQDPLERRNLAKKEPALLESMRGEVYAWLDAVLRVPSAAPTAAAKDPALEAIALGRLGDRRAIPGLVDLVRADGADPALRSEAARMLGMLTDERVREKLRPALGAKDPAVRAEVAIALGRLFDEHARSKLRELVKGPPSDVRSRAAVALARLRDRAAVPALVDAMHTASATYDREEAVRWLGRLRDARALEPLLAALADFKLRHLVAPALGLVGGPRARDALLELLAREPRADVRDQAVRGLGYASDASAAAAVVDVAVKEPGLTNALETLVRLGAVEAGLVGGVDMRPGAAASGLGACHENSPFHDWDYRQRTWCESTRAEVSVRIDVPSSLVGKPGTLALVARRLDSDAPLDVRVEAGKGAPVSWRLEKPWAEGRWPLGPLPRRLIVRLSSGERRARFGLDHVFVLPAPATESAAASGETPR